jgi:prefoldin subunit 5
MEVVMENLQFAISIGFTLFAIFAIDKTIQKLQKRIEELERALVSLERDKQ